MFSHVVLFGRLTADPELRRTKNDVPVTSFTLAVERRSLSEKGEKVTDFLSCVAWRGTAEFISRFFKKGNLILVSGDLQTKMYKDKSGKNIKIVEAVIERACFSGEKNNIRSRNDENISEGYYDDSADHSADDSMDEEELPF